MWCFITLLPGVNLSKVFILLKTIQSPYSLLRSSSFISSCSSCSVLIPFYQIMFKRENSKTSGIFHLKEFVKCFSNEIYQCQQFLITDVCNIELLSPGLLTEHKLLSLAHCNSHCSHQVSQSPLFIPGTRYTGLVSGARELQTRRCLATPWAGHEWAGSRGQGTRPSPPVRCSPQ